MISWLATWWWLIWACGALTALIAYRVAKRGGNEPLLRRIEYALIPATDPANARPRGQLSPRAAILIGGALVLLVLLNLLLLHNN